jgi:HEAT repeat protein
VNVYVLAGLLCCVPAGEDGKIVTRLEADFQQLLLKDKNPQPLRDAARLLEQTNESDRWTNYLAALTTLRRVRSRAAVPLLLKYMIVHASYNRNANEYVDALTLLTGEDIAARLGIDGNRGNVTAEATAKLAESWWWADKEKVTTDPGKMSRPQLELVVDRLLKQAERSRTDPRGASPETAAGVVGLLGPVLQSDRHGHERRTWWPEELHPAMVPVLLAVAGQTDRSDVKPGGAPPRENTRIPYGAIPMLASLRNNGEAPSLDRLAEDAGQNSALRLTCILALSCAGEDLKTQAVLSILEGEKKMERRLVAILALEHSRDPRAVARKLIALLDDPNDQIRTAAVFALRGCPANEALPRLKKILAALQPEAAVRATIQIVADLRTEEAGAALVEFLEAGLGDGKKARYLYEGLRAFESVSGETWIEPGAHDDLYYREKVRTALDWWKSRKK